MTLTESYWPGTDVTVLETTVGDVLRAASSATPDAPALTGGAADPAARRTWTYGELLADAERTARALLARFEPGDHVAIWAHNVPEWVLLEYGMGLAGVVLVTINPALRPDEAKYVLDQSKARGVFTVDAFRDQSLTAIATELQADLPGLEQVVSIDRWDEFLDGGDPNTQLPDVRPDDPAQVQYTSGTTGFPKGARLHHRGITNNGRLTRAELADGAVANVTPMPLFHTGGCVLAILGAATRGDHLILIEQFDPAVQLELIETYRAIITAGVPTMLIAVINHPDFATRDISTVRYVLSGGAMVPPDLVEHIESSLGASFQIVYGQTELSPVCNMTTSDDTIADKGTTVGAPLDPVEIKIVDVDGGGVAPCGTEGEVCVRGYLVMLDYFDMPDKTAETIDADGWLHTGDLGTMDDRGYVAITGRLKDMIIRGGENLFPAEIENRLYQHPSVAQVAVVGVPDDTWGEQVGAVIQPADPGAGIDVAALSAFCRDSMAGQKVPRLWYVADEYPMTGSGKIQKFALVEQIEKGLLQPVT